MIPRQNVINLMLDEEVTSAVQEGKFQIYAIDTIDEGLEILTGIPAGERDENGRYQEGTFNYLVQQKLELFNDLLIRKGKEQDKAETPAGENTSVQEEPAGEKE